MKFSVCKYYDANYGAYKVIVPTSYVNKVPAIRSTEFNNNRFRSWQKKIKKEDLIDFWAHVSTCLSSGISLLETMQLFPLKNANSCLKMLVKTVELQLDMGYKLSEIINIFDKSFDDFTLTILKTSELKGDYNSATQTILQHLKWQLETKKSIKNSLRYPAAVFFILLIVMAILMHFVIPEIANFLKMTNNSSTYYEDIMQVSAILGNTAQGLAYLITGLTITYYGVGVFSNSAKILKDSLLFKAPIIGEFTRIQGYCIYFYIMGQSLSSGANLQDSLNIAEKSIKNSYLRLKISAFKQGIKNGLSISQACDILPRTPKILKSSLRQAEINGAIAECLKQLALTFGHNYQEKINNLASALGPAMTVIMGLIILAIVMTVLFPIYDNLGSLNV